MMDRIGLGETGETYLVNTDGQIISESRFLSPVRRPKTALSIPSESRSALNRQDGTAVYQSYTGREVLGSYLWLPRYEWAILAEIETDEIMRPLTWIKTMGDTHSTRGDRYLSCHGIRCQSAGLKAHHPDGQCRT